METMFPGRPCKNVLSLSLLLVSLLPSSSFSEIVVHDILAVTGEQVMLKAETRGKLFSKGGQVVEFLVDQKPAGRTLSGGDGIALRAYQPKKSGLHTITARLAQEEEDGTLLSLRKGTGVLLIDISGSISDDFLAAKPRRGSQDAIRSLSKKFPAAYLNTGKTGVRVVKNWLKDHGFPALPVLPWHNGAVFEDITAMGLRTRAIIGGKAVIESAGDQKTRAFSFDETGKAEEVQDWEEIRKKMR